MNFLQNLFVYLFIFSSETAACRASCDDSLLDHLTLPFRTQTPGSKCWKIGPLFRSLKRPSLLPHLFFPRLPLLLSLHHLRLDFATTGSLATGLQAPTIGAPFFPPAVDISPQQCAQILSGSDVNLVKILLCSEGQDKRGRL